MVSWSDTKISYYSTVQAVQYSYSYILIMQVGAYLYAITYGI